ncbi:hypothetical protein [Clostridium butyricum]|uniref:hypothetical protein n=1 Tax=Clostridium butyricum TaxID=1492 RepID=UPI0005EBF180|nr:hypothetical protein [Clostridium butyricum]
MKRIELERESILIGIYCDVVTNLLKIHGQLSIIKTLVFAYIIKKGKFIPDKIYTAKNSKDIVCKCISLLSGDYEEYCNNIQYIIKSIHILISAGKLSINGDLLIQCKSADASTSIYTEDSFIEKAIKKSRNMTDRQFLKEVIQNV